MCSRMDTSELVKIINLSAISSFTPILDKCPDLVEIMKKGKTTTMDWDVLLTAAGVGFALTINSDLDKDVAIKTCTSIHSQLPKVLENYFDFISREERKDREMLGAQTGMWVVWNLLKEPPKYEEHKKLISLIGHYIDNLLK